MVNPIGKNIRKKKSGLKFNNLHRDFVKPKIYSKIYSPLSVKIISIANG